jgi:hypothetical protein
VLVTMEGEISNFERLIELAKECGFKILLAAMPRNLKRAEAELAEILALASVEAAASLAEQITSGAPGVYILATSREPLCAKSERVHHDVDGDTPLLWMLRDVHGMTCVVEKTAAGAVRLPEPLARSRWKSSPRPGSSIISLARRGPLAS